MRLPGLVIVSHAAFCLDDPYLILTLPYHQTTHVNYIGHFTALPDSCSPVIGLQISQWAEAGFCSCLNSRQFSLLLQKGLCPWFFHGCTMVSKVPQWFSLHAMALCFVALLLLNVDHGFYRSCITVFIFSLVISFFHYVDCA